MGNKNEKYMSENAINDKNIAQNNINEIIDTLNS